MRRLHEAIELLAPAGIVVTPLDAGQATAVLASACNPDTLLPPSADLDELLRYSDRILVFYSGRVLATLDARSADPDLIGHLIGGRLNGVPQARA